MTKQELLSVFDKLIGYLRDTVKFIDKYASKAIGAKARQMLQTVIDVRNLANQKLGEFLKPVQDFLERLAVRIEKESNQAFKATTNIKNIHNFKKVGTDAELKSVLNNKPNWVDVAAKEKYKALTECPKIPSNFPNIGAKDGPLRDAYKTFHDLESVHIKEGEVLYRVLDPRSLDNSICWMRESEYRKLKVKLIGDAILRYSPHGIIMVSLLNIECQGVGSMYGKVRLQVRLLKIVRVKLKKRIVKARYLY